MSSNAVLQLLPILTKRASKKSRFINYGFKQKLFVYLSILVPASRAVYNFLTIGVRQPNDSKARIEPELVKRDERIFWDRGPGQRPGPLLFPAADEELRKIVRRWSR